MVVTLDFNISDVQPWARILVTAIALQVYSHSFTFSSQSGEELGNTNSKVVKLFVYMKKFVTNCESRNIFNAKSMKLAVVVISANGF